MGILTDICDIGTCISAPAITYILYVLHKYRARRSVANAVILMYRRWVQYAEQTYKMTPSYSFPETFINPSEFSKFGLSVKDRRHYNKVLDLHLQIQRQQQRVHDALHMYDDLKSHNSNAAHIRTSKQKLRSEIQRLHSFIYCNEWKEIRSSIKALVLNTPEEDEFTNLYQEDLWYSHTP